MPREYAESVRICRLEVDHVYGKIWKDVCKRWLELSDTMQTVHNTIWQTWETWHVTNRSADKIRTWLNEREALRSQGKNVREAGKCPVQAVPKELNKAIYEACKLVAGNSHTRTWGLLMQIVIKNIQSRKATKGSLPGWTAILLCREGRPASTKPLPIPFDRANCSIAYDEKPTVWLRLNTENRKSEIDEIILRSGGSRSIKMNLDVFKKIVKGEFKFVGSKLAYDQRKRKWFVLLSYKRPVHRVPGLNHRLTAFLHAGRTVPFVLRMPGQPRRFWPIGKGHSIGAMRVRIFGTRRRMAEHYRTTGAAKGHGRKRVMLWRDKLSRAWSNFVHRENHYVSTRVVRECVNSGIGRLVYFQPTGYYAERRFVSKAGDTGKDQSTWEFFTLKTMLEYKCQDVGIELVVKRVGERESANGDGRNENSEHETQAIAAHM